MLDVDRLRGETNALKAHSGELASFAAALFELECAKKGDPDARANMLDTADSLLQFWRDKSGDQLAAAHPTLSQLWIDASKMLVSFEQKRLERALAKCFESRADAPLLQEALKDLTPAGDRRVELATCLYHLELARLFVDSSRVEFARRIALVQEAYLDPAVATELIGGDPGLQHLWKELIPYLDEFFEAQEQEEEARRRSETDPAARAVSSTSSPNLGAVPPPPPPVSDPSVATVPDPLTTTQPPSFVPEAEFLTSTVAAVPDEVEILEAREVSIEGDVAPAPPPPPEPLGEAEVEAIELEEAPPPPPKPSKPSKRDARLDYLSDYEPDEAAQAFWRHTETSLGLVPSGEAPRTGERVLSADGRAERKKLNAWLDGMSGQFAEVPEARAMQCLMRLYMATQIKEKTLFGQPNPKRKDAFRAALGLLSGDGAAAGRAAVWFELDGPDTKANLATALEMVQDFLQFCSREQKDPLDAAAVDEFLG
ncbi:MAG: hypothetical protein IPJ65_27275 [Archangiaceae bacterium]|nr:hypothetical protein [Archangiaceae bacterium]